MNNYFTLDKVNENDKLKDFEDFINDALGCKYNFEVLGSNPLDPIIGIKYKDATIPYQYLASSGMKSLQLFYYWYLIKKDTGLLVIDEFDAFYHHELSVNIIKRLIDMNYQCILTTHNTSVMDNEIMRPDNYFIIQNNNIKSLPELTDTELRKAHNIEKMYRGGYFK